MRARALLAAALLGVGCAASQARLYPDHALALASAVEYEADFAEVYDAAWLSLEKLGYRVEEHDRRQGTFAAVAEGNRRYEVQATPRQTRTRLELVPRHLREGRAGVEDGVWTLEGPGGEAERWAAVHAQVRALLDAWRTPPEFTYRPVGHAVVAVGVRLPMPAAWNALELRTDRRRFRLQAYKRTPSGMNPTLLLELDRRRPQPSLTPLAQEAAELSVADAKPEVAAAVDAAAVSGGRSGSLLFQRQEAVVEAEPFDLDVFTFRTETRAWAVKLAAVCPRPATTENAADGLCVGAVRAVVEGATLSPAASE